VKLSEKVMRLIVKEMNSAIQKKNKVDIIHVRLTWVDYEAFKLEMNITTPQIKINEVPIVWHKSVIPGTLQLVRENEAEKKWIDIRLIK